jgi:F-box and WD-40 domain protein 1/11
MTILCSQKLTLDCRNKIISGSRDRSVKVWDIKSGLCIKTISPSVSDATSQAEEIDLHSSALEDGGRALWPATVPRSQTLPIPASSDIAAPRGSSSMVHQASILCLDFDSDILVTGSSDRTCIVWNVRNNYTPIKRLTHHAGAVLDVCFDSQHIVSCSKDTTICIWDRETSTTLRRLSGHKGPVNAVQMRGNLIVSTSGDALIKLWNLESGRCIREFAGHERGLACVQFSEDSRLILSGGNDHIIRVWDANTGECIRELSGHNRLVRSLHLDTANQRVISGSYDHTVKVFDLSTGHLISDLQNWTDTWVLSSKADYRRMICTSQDGKILLLDYGHDLPDCHILES